MRYLALLLLTACTEFEMPPKPLALHCDGGDCEAFREGAKLWNEARPGLVRDAEPGEECGAYVVVGDMRLGYCQWVAPCRVHVMVRPGIERWKAVHAAAHEIGHALMTCDERDHSEDRGSVMYRQPIELVVTGEDLASVGGE